MVFDYYKENPYKKDEARFNSKKFSTSPTYLKQLLNRMFQKLDLI